MFDFQKWREWLREKAEELRSDGFVVEWESHNHHLRGTHLSAIGKSRIGSFRSFENGLVDYEVMEVETREIIANKAMIAVDDQNFPDVFWQFSASLKV